MRFSRDQLDMLERAFQESHYPTCFDRENLCAEIGVAEWQVTMWFKNQRAKNRRSYKEAKQQLLSQHNAATGVTFAVPEQSVAAAAPSAAAASTVRAAKSANRCGKGKGRRRAVTARTKTTRQAAGGKRKSRRGTLRTKAVAADADK